MNNKNNLTEAAISNFKDIVSLMESDRTTVEGEVYVGSKFLVTIGCNPFFRPIIDEQSPVRMNVARVVIIRSGWCEPVIGFKKYRCGPGDMLFINWGVMLNGDSFGANTTFDGITVTEEYMKLVFGGRMPEVFLSPGLCFSVHLSEREQTVWKQYVRTLYNLAHIRNIDPSVIRSLFVSALNFTESMYKSKGSDNHIAWSRNKRAIERFIRLVNDHAKTEHELDFYASQLDMTTHHLGMIIKKDTGTTAKEWIDKTLCVLLQLELRHTSKPLKVIADEFNFVSLSSLCKFFKRRTGMTASAYRLLSEHEE